VGDAKGLLECFSNVLASLIAELLKLSPRTVGEYAARGVLPSVKIGRHRRFSRRQLEALMAAGQKDGAEGERPSLCTQDIAGA
jgi:excisionase family DNA binding protein